jgi:hypothetical protein
MYQENISCVGPERQMMAGCMWCSFVCIIRACVFFDGRLHMVYKIIVGGLVVFLLVGLMYLGLCGITVVKCPIQIEVPIQRFIAK